MRFCYLNYRSESKKQTPIHAHTDTNSNTHTHTPYTVHSTHSQADDSFAESSHKGACSCQVVGCLVGFSLLLLPHLLLELGTYKVSSSSSETAGESSMEARAFPASTAPYAPNHLGNHNKRRLANTQSQKLKKKKKLFAQIKNKCSRHCVSVIKNSNFITYGNYLLDHVFK